MGIPVEGKLLRDAIVLDRYIAEGEARVARQARVVAELAQRGADTRSAEQTLAALRGALEALRHRRASLQDRRAPGLGSVSVGQGHIRGKQRG